MCGIRSNTGQFNLRARPGTSRIPSKPGGAADCRAATGWQPDLEAQDEVDA